MKLWNITYSQKGPTGWSMVFGLILKAENNTAALNAARARLPGCTIWGMDEITDTFDDRDRDEEEIA